MPRPNGGRWKKSEHLILQETNMSETTDDASTPVLETSGARATIRLNRPRHLNRLQQVDLEALLVLFDRIEADPSIRVVVLTGTGRAFSAGFDLGSIAERVTGDAAPQAQQES